MVPSPSHNDRHRAGILPRAFFERSVHDVARDLLGMIVVRTLGDGPGRTARLAGRIVEVEAYDGPRDLACHASKGRTGRTDVMFGEAGHAYIYLIYGMHRCLNVVTGPSDYPAAVLVRALEPIEGVERMSPGRAPAARIASGPGRLTRALGIDLSLNRADLCVPGPIVIESGAATAERDIVRGPRIGVEYAGAWAGKPWRLGVLGSPALSRPFRAGARRKPRA
ncbi:MAG TPA: DNA-3-methyladenine glycosylase [Candidatus Polarisedimenticolia bacterium]|nr:DNA-3-methyladenine glycosylase [Candidatus Polarisedimenticolia bacterium]